MTRLSSQFWNSNRFLAVTAARDRIDALSGLLGLGAGFALQAAGYLVGLSGDHPTRTGAAEALVGAGLGAVALVAVLALGWLHRRARVMPTLIEMSHYLVDGTRLDHPRSILLPGFLKALGHQPREGEEDLAFVRRVVEVDDLIVEIPASPKHPERTRLASEPPLEGEHQG